MSTECQTLVIYGFQLDSKKLKSFEKGYKKIYSDFDIFEWFREVCENKYCDFFIDNAWHDDIEICDVYFGLVYENHLNPSLMVELEADRREEVIQEFIEVFGNCEVSAEFVLEEEYDLTPMFHAFTQTY